MQKVKGKEIQNVEPNCIREDKATKAVTWKRIHCDIETGIKKISDNKGNFRKLTNNFYGLYHDPYGNFYLKHKQLYKL